VKSGVVVMNASTSGADVFPSMSPPTQAPGILDQLFPPKTGTAKEKDETIWDKLTDPFGESKAKKKKE